MAVHEFGHALGFALEVDHLASMNPSHPTGGALAARRVRIGEDDFVALVNLESHASTGVNLTLWRFKP